MTTLDASRVLGTTPPACSDLGGPEVWVLSGHGKSDTHTDVYALILIVGRLLQEGHRTLRIERQGKPNTRPDRQEETR